LANVTYIAGFLDGEGHIAIEKTMPGKGLLRIVNPHFGVRVTIANTDLRTLEWIHELWGGKVYVQKRQGLRPVYSWMITNRQVVTEFLATLLPHLRSKKDQAELVLEYLSAITVKRSYGRNTMPDAEVALRDGYRERLLELRRPQRLNEQPLTGTTGRVK